MTPSLFASFVALSLAVAAPAAAQWPNYPSKKIPRTADGKVNFDAPAPRTADGKIDFTGVYENLWFYNGRIGQPPASPPGEPPQTTFSEIGAGFKGGLPFRPWAAELYKQRKESNAKDNPDAYCLPMGLMQFHNHGQPRKMVQTPNELLIIYEANYGLRHIFTDGRKLPDNDPTPWWYGYSVGTWDGDALVVQTTGLRDDGWLDIIGNPLTSAAKLTERFRRPNFGTLEIDITVDDAKAYTKPWTVRVNQRILLNSELIEFICNENDQFRPYLARQK